MKDRKVIHVKDGTSSWFVYSFVKGFRIVLVILPVYVVVLFLIAYLIAFR